MKEKRLLGITERWIRVEKTKIDGDRKDSTEVKSLGGGLELSDGEQFHSSTSVSQGG